MWCEQGQKLQAKTGASQVANILRTYRDTNWIILTTSTDVGDGHGTTLNAMVKSNSTFYYVCAYNGSTFSDFFYYIAQGYLA